MPRGCTVELTEREQAAVAEIARARTRAKFVGQSARSRLSRDPAIRLDLASTAGQYAFQKLSGLSLDLSVSSRGDRGAHFLLPSGQRLDVKTTRRRGGPLIMGGEKAGMRFRADIVVLAEVEEPFEVRLVGWISRREFGERAETMDFGYGERQYVRQGALRPIPELLPGIEEDAPLAPPRAESGPPAPAAPAPPRLPGF